MDQDRYSIRPIRVDDLDSVAGMCWENRETQLRLLEKQEILGFGEQFIDVCADADDANRVGITLAEDCANTVDCHGLLQWYESDMDIECCADGLVDNLLSLCDFFVGHCMLMREVESQSVVCDKRAALFDMITED